MVDKAKYGLTKQNRGSKVSEAAVEYIAGRREEPVVSTISSKNQITLPAHLLREMGIGAGDRLTVSLEGSRLVLRARPRDWVKYHAGSLAGVYGKDRAEADAYLQELRANAAREAVIERAWSGPEPTPER